MCIYVAGFDKASHNLWYLSRILYVIVWMCIFYWIPYGMLHVWWNCCYNKDGKLLAQGTVDNADLPLRTMDPVLEPLIERQHL